MSAMAERRQEDTLNALAERRQEDALNARCKRSVPWARGGRRQEDPVHLSDCRRTETGRTCMPSRAHMAKMVSAMPDVLRMGMIDLKSVEMRILRDRARAMRRSGRSARRIRSTLNALRIPPPTFWSASAYVTVMSTTDVHTMKKSSFDQLDLMSATPRGKERGREGEREGQKGGGGVGIGAGLGWDWVGWGEQRVSILLTSGGTALEIEQAGTDMW